MARKGSKDRGVIFKDGKWWVRLCERTGEVALLRQ
jgi:hypothetical protein